MDGNDSLKRILRREYNSETGERDGPSREREDSRSIAGDMYISRDEVDKWAKDVVQEAMGLEEVCLHPRLPNPMLIPPTGRSRLQSMCRAMEEHEGGAHQPHVGDI
jgi:hypothetical protein